MTGVSRVQPNASYTSQGHSREFGQPHAKGEHLTHVLPPARLATGIAVCRNGMLQERRLS
jgi:hypothetical protein